MIDAFAIFLSTIFVVYVVFRAYAANKTEVWFKATPLQEPPEHGSGRRRRPFSTSRRS